MGGGRPRGGSRGGSRNRRSGGRPPHGAGQHSAPKGSGRKGLGGRQIEGRNAVRELLMGERRRVHEIWISSELEGDAGFDHIVTIANKHRIALGLSPPFWRYRQSPPFGFKYVHVVHPVN